MQHTELQTPVELAEWQAFLMGADPPVTFQDYRTLYEGPTRFTITDELNQIVDDFRPASCDAVYAVLGEEIYAVWIDPLHNYLAVRFTEDEALIICYSKAEPDPPRESPSSTTSVQSRPARDDESELPHNVVSFEERALRSKPASDLSDVDRVH